MSNYYLTDSQRELDRLGFQHQVWSKETIELWKRANLTVGERVLDLGCGPGYATFNLAQIVGPSGKVTAIDSSEHFISYLKESLKGARINNVEAHVMDINKIEFEENSFDSVYSRMVMCFLDDPFMVLKKLMKCLKPGGKVIITDFFSYSESFRIFPTSTTIQKAMAAIEEGNSLTGGNFNIQKEIPDMLVQLGFNILDTQATVKTGKPGESSWHWPEQYFSNMLPKMLEMGLLSESEVQSFWRDWKEREANKNSVFLSPILLDLVAEKPKFAN